MNLSYFHFWLSLLVSTSIASSKVLNEINFKEATKDGLWFIKFYSPSCKYCRKIAPKWENITNLLTPWSQSLNFKFGELDCSANYKFCQDSGIEAYPTLNLLKDGEVIEECETYGDETELLACVNKYSIRYHITKPPSLNSLVSVQNQIEGAKIIENSKPKYDRELAKPKLVETSKVNKIEALPINPVGEVVILNEDNFKQVTSHGGWFIKFYAPWCSHCKKLAPTWTDLALELKGKVNIGQVDCTENETVCKENKVRGYPTLKHFFNGNGIEYQGSRALESLKDKSLEQFGPKPKINESELKTKIKNDEVGLVYLGSETSSPPPSIDLVLQDLALDLPKYQLNELLDLEQFNLPKYSSILIFKDNKLLAMPDSDLPKALQWVKTNQYPLVRNLKLNQVINGLDQLSFIYINKQSNTEDSIDLKSFAESIKEKDVIVANLNTTDQLKDCLVVLNLVEKNLPAIVLLDSKNKMVYSKSSDDVQFKVDLPILSKALESFEKNQLEGKILSPKPRPSIFANLSALQIGIILLPFLLILFLAYSLYNVSSQDEQIKKAI